MLSVGEKKFLVTRNGVFGTFLVVPWLRLHAPNARGIGSIPGQGIDSHMLQLMIPHAITEDPACCIQDQRFCIPTTMTQHRQINIKF